MEKSSMKELLGTNKFIMCDEDQPSFFRMTEEELETERFVSTLIENIKNKIVNRTRIPKNIFISSMPSSTYMEAKIRRRILTEE